MAFLDIGCGDASRSWIKVYLHHMSFPGYRPESRPAGFALAGVLGLPPICLLAFFLALITLK